MNSRLPAWLALEGDARADALNGAAKAIRSGQAAALRHSERAFVFHELKRQSELGIPTWYLTALWILTFTARDEIFRLWSWIALLTKSLQGRGCAFTYLGVHYPEDAELAFQHSERDHDPDLLYALGGHVLDVDRSKAVHLWIDAALEPMTVVSSDTIALEIAGAGQAEHLERLKRIIAADRSQRYLAGIVWNLQRKLQDEGVCE